MPEIEQLLLYLPLILCLLSGVATCLLISFVSRDWFRGAGIHKSIIVGINTATILTSLMLGGALTLPIWHELEPHPPKKLVSSQAQTAVDTQWNCTGHEIDAYYQSVEDLQNLLKLQWLLDHFALRVLIPAFIIGLLCHSIERGKKNSN